MLDFDLASLYQVETRVLNQAVKRNIERFPDDFMFQLTAEEWALISSQFVMTSRSKRPKRALPLAFTEHGALMLSSVLRSGPTRCHQHGFGRIAVRQKPTDGETATTHRV